METNPIALGPLKVGDEIVMTHTNLLFISWRERIINYQEKWPDKKFSLKHIKSNIVVKRLK